MMTRKQYKAERTRRGLSQVALGRLLGVHFTTVCRRETGVYPITKEMERAIKSLPEAPEKGGSK